jgi:tetratricopeptide (TPR) repeat protein
MKTYRLILAFALASCTTKPGPATVGDPVARARALALQAPAGGDPADALILDQERKLEHLPKKHDLWILLGQAWVRKARESADPGFYLNADACAEIALDLVPDSALAKNLRALVLLNGHRFKEARALAQEMLTKNPDDLMALGSLSDASLELGDHEGAVAAVDHMLEIKPSLPSFSRASYLRWLEGDREGAMDAIRLAFDAGRGQPDKEPAAWALVQAAMYFWHHGDYAGADAGFDLALGYYPGFAPALVGKGRVQLSLGHPERAVKSLEAAFRAAPTAQTAWLLGNARERSGDKKGAEQAWVEVERIGRSTDKHTLALFLATKNKKLDLALELAEQERSARGDVYTLDTYAFVLYRLGRLEGARAAIDRAARLGTEDAQILFHQGTIHLASGDANGKELIKKALALNPGFDSENDARALDPVRSTRSGS